jgi:hypothetical protein
LGFLSETDLVRHYDLTLKALPIWKKPLPLLVPLIADSGKQLLQFDGHNHAVRFTPVYCGE